jgi:serine/threonine protein kinase
VDPTNRQKEEEPCSPPSSTAPGDAALQKQASTTPLDTTEVKLGQGQAGSVYRGYDFATGEFVAIKKMYVRSVGEWVAAQHEFKLHTACAPCSHIVKALALIPPPPPIGPPLQLATSSVSDSPLPAGKSLLQQRHAPPNECHVIMELMEGGSVADLLDVVGPIHELEARTYILHALRGLDFLHSQSPPVLHRDVKPGNMLLSADAALLKLADFGISKEAERTSVEQTLGVKGTPYYMAPELFDLRPHWSTAIDVWALGCAWLAMVYGGRAWEGVFEPNTPPMVFGVHLLSKPTLRPIIPPFLSPPARALLDRCLNRDPLERPTIAELLATPYFAAPVIDAATASAMAPTPTRPACDESACAPAAPGTHMGVSGELSGMTAALSSASWVSEVETSDAFEARRERVRPPAVVLTNDAALGGATVCAGGTVCVGEFNTLPFTIA